MAFSISTIPGVRLFKDKQQGDFTHTPAKLSGKNLELLHELFSKVAKTFKPFRSEEYATVWSFRVTVPRGSIDSWMTFEEYREQEESPEASEEEWHSAWLSWFPYTVCTCEISLRRDKLPDGRPDALAVFLDNAFVFQEGSLESHGSLLGNTELQEAALNWMLQSVDVAARKLRDGTYAAEILKATPHCQRTGVVSVEVLRQFLGKDCYFSPDDIPAKILDTFLAITKGYKPQSKLASPLDEQAYWEACGVARYGITGIPEGHMTAKVFFDALKAGYKAVGKCKDDSLSGKALYRIHADGRDEGLMEIDENSAEAFSRWYNDRQRGGGHPWEVCRGGNSTHISLYVLFDRSKRVYFLSVSGRSVVRYAEAIQMFVAMHEAGFPVAMQDAERLRARIFGTELVGIVPDDVVPAYCHNRFREEDKVDAVMHLPLEVYAPGLSGFVRWYPLEMPELL